jgi:predicted NBD/HSP70 family sugar kinase
MVGRAGTPRLLRGINDRAALDLLLERGPLSRSQLGELTGLSKPTTSQLLERLENVGLVVASGRLAGRPGPNAQLYEINASTAYVAGLDVTPARIRCAIADLTGRMVHTAEVATPRGRNEIGTVERVVQVVDSAASAAGLERTRLHRVVIGTPGAFDPGTERLRYARHLPGWHHPHLIGDLAKALGIPLDVDNDVNLAAVAEQHVGKARRNQNFVLLWVDEGIGAAVVIDGRLHRGATGGAGEVGFLPLPGTPLVRNVGRSNAGGFQELAGGNQVLALARRHGLRASTPESAVTKAVNTAGAGDAVLEELAERLAIGLAAIVAVLDPELVVLAGAVSTAGGERLRRLVQAELATLAVARPAVQLTGIDHDPVLRGALLSALDTTRDEVFDTLQPSESSRDAAPRRNPSSLT